MQLIAMLALEVAKVILKLSGVSWETHCTLFI